MYSGSPLIRTEMLHECKTSSGQLHSYGRLFNHWRIVYQILPNEEAEMEISDASFAESRGMLFVRLSTPKA
jgi:hypothetical protein